MLYEIFPSPYAPLLATLVWSILIGLIGHFVVFKLAVFDVLIKAPAAPPMISVPAVMFAFFMAFMGSAAWQNIGLARLSLVSEHAALVRLEAVPIGPAEAKQQLQTGVKRYVAAVIDDEWAKRHNEQASPEAEAALDTLGKDMWAISSQCRALPRPDCTTDLGTSTYLKALDDLRAARDQRLSLAFQGTLRIKWALGIVLAIVTALAIAGVHRSNARTAAICQVLFCLSIWMTFAMVALNIQPYRGPDALSPGILQEIRGKL